MSMKLKRMSGKLKVFIVSTLFICVFIIALEVLPTILYVYKTYVKRASFVQYTRNITDIRKIPRHIHQSYFNVNNDGLLEKYRFAQQSWMRLNPSFRYTLWNKSMTDTLVKEQYPNLYQLYRNYPSWMTQHEIGRYVVVHHYGGIYADLDVERIGDIHYLLDATFLKKQQVILHLGNLNLAGTDFFAAPKRHPFLEHVMSGLSESNRWYIIPYLNVMFTAGATYFHGCYRNYRYKGEMLVLADSNEYVLHHRASSWLRWDGEVIVWFDKRRYIVKISLILLILCTGIKIYFVLKKMRKQSKERRETIFKHQN